MKPSKIVKLELLLKQVMESIEAVSPKKRGEGAGRGAKSYNTQAS